MSYGNRGPALPPFNPPPFRGVPPRGPASHPPPCGPGAASPGVLSSKDQVHVSPHLARLLDEFTNFPYQDPNQPICQCGCGVPVAINTTTNSLCMAMLDQSGSDYTYYKRIYDHCIAHVERAGTVAPMSLQGFKTHARNCGVDKYGWAIVDVTAASRVLQLCMQTAAQGGKGPATFESIVSIGSGVAYVEFMFHQAAQQLGCGTQVHCYDILPHCYQAYLPLQYGTPETITQSFPSTARSILLLVWPPIGHLLPDGSPAPQPNTTPNPMASDALRRFVANGGRFLVYIGEKLQGGCTGDPEFHRMLQDGNWALLNEDRNGNSTISMDKWCPHADAAASGANFISGVSGNDNIWVYFLKSPPRPHS